MSMPGNTVQRAAMPVAVVAADSARRFIPIVAGIVVTMPLAGTFLAIGLAIAFSVSTSSLAMFAVAYLLSTLGVTLGFHRHFAHRSFRTSRAMQALLIVLGSCALQGSLLYWVSTHRRHHQFSDTSDDPHSPHIKRTRPLGWLDGLWHSHIGWMFDTQITNAIRFAPDILRDRWIFAMQRRYVLWAATGLLLPIPIGALLDGGYGALEALLWAGPVRLLLVHHASWAVGSISHMYGSRPFDTGDHSANNFWIALVAFGEGLQNNHHAFPSAALHAFRWWEPDLTGCVVRILAAIGVIWDVAQPSSKTISDRRYAPPEGTPDAT